MTCGIYMIQNLVNGKMYIGQAVDIEKRWVDHKKGLRGNYHINKHLQNAWNKYGEDNFEFTIICECGESQLDTMEIDYIAKLKTYDPKVGYNKTYGGDSERPTEDTKKKISESMKGKYCGKNNPNYGKHHSEETKRKISEALKGITPSEETKKKMSEANKGKNNPFYGKHHSEDSKKKISESGKGRTFSEETKKKISKANSIPIVQIGSSTNNIVNVWSSSHDAQRLGGFHQTLIIQCCKCKRNTHKGYKWQYLHEYISKIDPRIKKVILFDKDYKF